MPFTRRRSRTAPSANLSIQTTRGFVLNLTRFNGPFVMADAFVWHKLLVALRDLARERSELKS